MQFSVASIDVEKKSSPNECYSESSRPDYGL